MLPMALLACSGGGSPDLPPCAEVRALFNGSAAAPAALGGAADSAVAVVVRHQQGADDAALCTGVRVDARHVVTAAHCLDGDPKARVSLLAGPDVALATRACQSGSSSAVEEGLAVRLLPGRDVAVIETAPSLAASATPCTSAPIAPSSAFAVGYGLDEDGVLGNRRYLATQVVAVSDEIIETLAPTWAGTCVGDSGGPLFVTALDGQVCVAGTLATGSADCHGRGRYTVLTAALASP